jgi:uncharacterized protein (UPF0261 family)
MNRAIYAIATMDTKGQELRFLAERLRAAGLPVVTVDVSAQMNAAQGADVDRRTMASALEPDQASKLLTVPQDRGSAVTAMGEALTAYLLDELSGGRIMGVIGLGGSCGTALVTHAMRALPIGLPKLMVSTVASGNTAPYVGLSDIVMIPSVTDIAGLNTVSRRVLATAAAALAGMVREPMPSVASENPTIAMTMFGVTTPCVTGVRERLESRGYDCLVFHATGTGGQTMEKLVEAGLIQGVLDITTTEVADEVVGGTLACGPRRFDAIIDAKIPFVLSLGALDMVNFGAIETVPAQFRDRRLHVHNAQVTLMRTTPDECRRCARFIAGKLNRTDAQFRILIPTRGISALDAPGQPFHDPEADLALFDEIEKAIVTGPGRSITRLPLHINDPEFAIALADAYINFNHETTEAAS